VEHVYAIQTSRRCVYWSEDILGLHMGDGRDIPVAVSGCLTADRDYTLRPDAGLLIKNNRYP
jgi:hypothetical protein